jgi:hypothetical protein
MSTLKTMWHKGDMWCLPLTEKWLLWKHWLNISKRNGDFSNYTTEEHTCKHYQENSKEIDHYCHSEDQQGSSRAQVVEGCLGSMRPWVQTPILQKKPKERRTSFPQQCHFSIQMRTFFFFGEGGTGVWTQRPTLARPVLSHLGHARIQFYFSFFPNRIFWFRPGRPGPRSSYLHLAGSRDDMCATTHSLMVETGFELCWPWTYIILMPASWGPGITHISHSARCWMSMF